MDLVLGLVIVEIAVAVGRHDDVIAGLGRLDAAFRAPPGHHGSARLELAFEDLVPADDLLALGCEELLDPVGHIALQVLLGGAVLVVLESQFADLGLAVGVGFPFLLGALVAPDMDVFRREEVRHFGQDVLQEDHRLFLADVEDLVRDAPFGANLVGTCAAAQFRVGGQRRDHVAGKVDLGDDGDAQFVRVCDDVPDLVLGVVSAVADAVVALPVLGDHRAVAEGADLREFGIALELDAPALVLGQMPVEAVELVHRHDVEVAFHFRYAEEMASAVEVRTPVAEARRILDHDGGEIPFHLVGGGLPAVDLDGQHLLERLDGIEESIAVRRCDGDRFLADGDRVFAALQGRVAIEGESLGGAVPYGLGNADGGRERAGLSADLGQLDGEAPDGALADGIDGRVAVELGAAGLETALLHLHALGIGDHVEGFGLFGDQTDGGEQEGRADGKDSLGKHI